MAGNFDLDDVALYDPANPRIATLLSGMSPPLEISPRANGRRSKKQDTWRHET